MILILLRTEYLKERTKSSEFLTVRQKKAKGRMSLLNIMFAE